MTFSLLAFDPTTKALGGIAATGALCVGGWVLAGGAQAGIVASQGQAPSTLWRDQVLELMGAGVDAPKAVAKTVAPDEGREHRQLSALDTNGQFGVFTGIGNGDYKGHVRGKECIASGNILAENTVLDSMVRTYEDSSLTFADRLLDALKAGERVGGDKRGVQSAAILIISVEQPPLSLRIDHHESPIDELTLLLQKTRERDYRTWLKTIPTIGVPYRF